MKHLAVPTVLTMMLAMSNPAAASSTEFQLDENYSEMAPAAGDQDLNAQEIDHNIMEGVNDRAADAQSEKPPVDAPDAPPVQKQKPGPKVVKSSSVVKKNESTADVPAPKTAKVKTLPAREIPLIQTENPAESSPDVNYVTGGIGEDEKASIEAAKGDYNLHVMSASVNGAFVGDARVVISKKEGAETKEVLNVVAGPLLYVKLPAGSYALDASLGEQKKHQNFTVGKSAANVHLSWKVPATVTGDPVAQ